MTAPQPAAAPGGGTGASHRDVLRALTGILSVFFMAMVTLTIIGTALPVIMADLGGDQTSLSWTVTGTLLANAATTPVWGKLADLFDKKKLLQLSIVIFVLGSAMAGLSPTIEFLILARVVQGIAMGGIMALAMTIMGTIIPPRERGRYAGYMGAVMAVATSAGPLLGGLIVDLFGWRWVFLIPAPLAVLAAVLVHRTLQIPPQAPRRVSIDWLGIALLIVSASALLLWVSLAGQPGMFAWVSGTSAALLATALVGTVLFVLVEQRAAEPVVPIRVVTERTTALAILAAIATGGAMFASTTYLGQYFQLGQGFSPTMAGVLMLPQVFGSLVGATVAGQLITRYGRWKIILVVAAVLMSTGLFLASTLTHDTPLWAVSAFILLVGLGIGALNQNLVLAVQNTVGLKDMGAASSSVAFFRTMGGAVAVAVFGALMSSHLAAELTARTRAQGGDPAAVDSSTMDLDSLPASVEGIVREAYGTGTGLVFLVAAIASLVTLLAVLLIKEVPLRRTVDIVEVDPETGQLKVVTRTLDAREVRRRQREAGTGRSSGDDSVADPDAGRDGVPDRVHEDTSTGPVDRV
ncbi:MDR family MFS transporter [Kocuria sp. SM24M-10]|uniref:MDR family MFS transporter n=1 Tax=Kocuria sp. SM24M-10 TaxID=1660349 RepID=UPI0006492A15|nr:MDR family MFS transporter [Kocuria sp. SM24M-10]KLU08268.1 major facilitator transporter [Kocuria sp. SM24M-10]